MWIVHYILGRRCGLALNCKAISNLGVDCLRNYISHYKVFLLLRLAGHTFLTMSSVFVAIGEGFLLQSSQAVEYNPLRTKVFFLSLSLSHGLGSLFAKLLIVQMILIFILFLN